MCYKDCNKSLTISQVVKLVRILHALRVRKVHDGFPDYTCAFFNENYSKTLKQAQEDKHAWIFENLGLGQHLAGKKVLDIGCGWGPILNAVKKRGGVAVGLTLSSGQANYCKKYDFDVRLQDYKNLKDGELPHFDGIVSVGAMEAFCSVEEFEQGKQMEIYKNLFKICADMLQSGNRLFIQTMVWGKHIPDPKKISLDAEPHSEEAILARITKFYPGSFAPANLKQIIESAKPYFKCVLSNNGRLDYLETLKKWGHYTKNLLSPSILPQSAKAIFALAKLAILDKNTRTQLASLYYNDQEECFRREIMSHERIFFEKKK